MPRRLIRGSRASSRGGLGASGDEHFQGFDHLGNVDLSDGSGVEVGEHVFEERGSCFAGEIGELLMLGHSEGSARVL